jgi:hypothetical protein
MLNLLAAAPEDGWAFVKRGEETLLVRPPYRRWNLSVVPESAVEKAILTHGFVPMEESFAQWDALVAFLEQQLVEARKAQGQAIPDSQSVRELVRHAPPHILEVYLDRVESELLPEGEWTAAQDLLALLIGLETVQDNAVLLKRTADLLGSCQTAKAQAESRRRELIDEQEDLARWFPNAVRRYAADPIREFMRQVWERQQLMAVGI